MQQPMSAFKRPKEPKEHKIVCTSLGAAHEQGRSNQGNVDFLNVIFTKGRYI